MKIQPSLSVLVVLILTSITNFVHARPMGVKEGGGDNATALRCQSPPNSDSSLEIIGFGYEFTNEIELRIFVGGRLLAADIGLLNTLTNTYTGQTFDIEISPNGKITAKDLNSVLAVGSSDTVICEQMEVQ